MKFIIEIDCDNAAFENDADGEIMNILKKLTDDMHNGAFSVSFCEPAILRDTNGNSVGTAHTILDAITDK
jgi:hypothetical protein